MKKIITFTLVLFLLFAINVNATNLFTVNWNNHNLENIINIDGRLYVQIRELSKIYNLDLTWDSATNTATVKNKSIDAILGSVCYLAAETTIGTGFYISENQIATSYHVVKNATNIQIIHGILGWKCQLDKFDEINDIAILTTNLESKPLLLAITAPKLKDKIFVIGNPLGIENTVSTGVVSGLDRWFNGRWLSQTTAPISPGSSGGPILNYKNEVVGICTASIPEGQNLNFFTPVKYLIDLINK
jgi:S1-C subfamily serine protease